MASENSIMYRDMVNEVYKLINQYGSFGENLGRYQFTPKEIISGWHNSAKHYACMMSEKYTRVGIGIAQDSEGYYYWSAIFMD